MGFLEILTSSSIHSAVIVPVVYVFSVSLRLIILLLGRRIILLLSADLEKNVFDQFFDQELPPICCHPDIPAYLNMQCRHIVHNLQCSLREKECRCSTDLTLQTSLLGSCHLVGMRRIFTFMHFKTYVVKKENDCCKWRQQRWKHWIKKGVKTSCYFMIIK